MLKVTKASSGVGLFVFFGEIGSHWEHLLYIWTVTRKV